MDGIGDPPGQQPTNGDGPNLEYVLAQQANAAMSNGADPHAATDRLGQMIRHLRAHPDVAQAGSKAIANGADPMAVMGRVWHLTQSAPPIPASPGMDMSAPSSSTGNIDLRQPSGIPSVAADDTAVRSSPKAAPEPTTAPAAQRVAETVVSGFPGAQRAVAGYRGLVSLAQGEGLQGAANEVENALHEQRSDVASMPGLARIPLQIAGGGAAAPILAPLGLIGGGAAYGAAQGADQPAESLKDRAINTAVGGAVGGATAYATQLAGRGIKALSDKTGLTQKISSAVDQYAPNFLKHPMGGSEAPQEPAPQIEPPDGLEERNLGPLSTEARKKIVQGSQELFTNPNAGLAAQGGTKAVAEQRIAAANAAYQLPTYAKQQAEAALSGLSDLQKQQFDARIVQDNLEAEAARKVISAPDVAQRASSAAAAIKAQLPDEDVAQAPWFQKALESAKHRVLPVTEGLAPEAGVSPESFRKPSLGLYSPLLGSLEDEAPQAATQAPSYGRPTTRTSGSANPFTGTAEQYAVGDYPSRVAADAQGKAVSAAKNRVLSAVASTGREIADRSEATPEAERVFAFNNKNEIVNVPSKGSEPGVRMFAVPQDIADAVDRYQAKSPPPPGAMRALKSASTAATKAVLLNPAVAPFHALREAGSLGTVGSGNLAEDAVMALPFAKSATTLGKAMALDVNDPAFIEADRKAVLAGAARVAESKEGVLSAGHNWLFGPPGTTETGSIPTGIDRRIRALATMQFTEDRAAKGLETEGPEYDAALRKFVNDHVGNYVAKNRGAIMQAIKSIAPFEPMHTAGAVTGLKSLVGESGLSEPTTTQKIGTFLRGPAGAIAAAAGATKLISGRSPTENGRDRETAIGLPLYNVPGKALPQFYYGSGADAVARFGPGAKAISLRDPGQSAMTRILSPFVYAPTNDKVGDVTRNAVNFATSYAGPLLSGAATASGHPLYLGADGKPATDNVATLSTTKKLAGHVGRALQDATAAGALLPGGSSRSIAQTLFPSITEGSPLSRQKDFQAKFNDFRDAVRMSLYRSSGDPKQQQQIITDALNEARSNGMKTGAFEAELRRAAARSRSPAAALGAQRKFQAKYGGNP